MAITVRRPNSTRLKLVIITHNSIHVESRRLLPMTQYVCDDIDNIRQIDITLGL